MRWMVPAVCASLMQAGGCSFIRDMQAAALDGAILSVSNGVFGATQSLFLDLFRV